ncbi:MAG: MBL fold metallo-hydrolase [Xanthomonadales bacterium]|nr:MBL fold metallo-hydrolase [Xanthomonadales bacterium]
MMKPNSITRCLLLLVLSISVHAGADAPDPLLQTFTELAPGVWLGNRPDSTRLPVTPNTTFVIGADGVVVFDGGNLPLVADRVIEKIRALTDLPVTHLIISHWHMDHVLGVSRYLHAFPQVQIIAHPYTRELIARYLAQHDQDMRNTVSDNAPEIAAMLEKDAQSTKPVIDAKTAAWYQQFVDDSELLEAQYRNFVPAYPNLVIDGNLSLFSGGRDILVQSLGTGNTPGDLVMWLPQEKILASGDIVVWPVPYGHGGHPKEWAQTLRKLAAMDFAWLIPGHGDVQTKPVYMELLGATLESVSSQMTLFVAQGMDQAAAKTALDLSSFEAQFTGGDAFLAARFDEWFTDPIGTAAWLIARGQDPEIVQ